ncbi:efp [Symbiodinium sp. CCMP2592]|nr:efp [Symbiodinium sp. CCMP2592]
MAAVPVLDMYTEHEPRRPLPADCDGTDKSFVEIINQWMKTREQYGRLRRGFHIVEAKGQHSAEEAKFRGGRSILERKRSESLVAGTTPLRIGLYMREAPAHMWCAQAGWGAGSSRADPSVGQLMAHYPKYPEVAADVMQEDWPWSCLEVDRVRLPGAAAVVCGNFRKEVRSFLDGLRHDELIYLAGDATKKVLPGDWGLYRLLAAAKRWEGGVGCTALVTIGLGFLAKQKADQVAPILSKILQWHSERGSSLWQAHQMMQDKSQASINAIAEVLPECKLNSGSKFNEVETQWQVGTYSYRDESDNTFHIMDMETFEDNAVPASLIGDIGEWLTEGMQIEFEIYEGKVIDIQVPDDIVLEVTEIVSKKDSGKDALVQLENGVNRQAPAYIKVGDKVQINKKTFEIQKRVD